MGQREDYLAVPLAAAGAARPSGALVDVPLALLRRWVLEKAALLIGIRIWKGIKIYAWTTMPCGFCEPLSTFPRR